MYGALRESPFPLCWGGPSNLSWNLCKQKFETSHRKTKHPLIRHYSKYQPNLNKYKQRSLTSIKFPLMKQTTMLKYM